MKNLLTRTLSGIIYAALIVGCTLAGGWWFVSLLILFVILAVVEFHQLTDSGEPLSRKWLPVLADTATGVLLVAGFSWSLSLLAVALFVLILRPIIQFYVHEDAPLSRLAYSYMSVLYIALPLALLGFMMTIIDGNDAKALIMTMFVMIWLNDTGAFLVGSAIGRHKLFPSISPKKSWEGAIGGVAFSIAVAFVAKYCLPGYFGFISIGELCIMGFITGVFSIFGDLVESLVKRSLGVKDSGKLIPGHGGILDRIDSILLVSPAVAVYFFIIFWCI